MLELPVIPGNLESSPIGQGTRKLCAHQELVRVSGAKGFHADLHDGFRSLGLRVLHARASSYFSMQNPKPSYPKP